MVASSRIAMAFEITGHKAGLEGAFVRTQAHTAADALRFARQWAEQGLTGITIVNPKGESYDIDRFGMIVSTTEDGLHADQSKSPEAPRRCGLTSPQARSAPPPRPTHEVEQEP